MVKSYKLASLIGLLALCSGLHAMENNKPPIITQSGNGYLVETTTKDHHFQTENKPSYSSESTVTHQNEKGTKKEQQKQHKIEKAVAKSNLEDSKKQYALKTFIGNIKNDMKSIIQIMDLFSLNPNEILQDIFLEKYKTSILGHVILKIYKDMEDTVYNSITDNKCGGAFYSEILGCRGPFYWIGIDAKNANEVKPIEKNQKLILKALFKRKADLNNFIVPYKKSFNTGKTTCVNPQKALKIIMEEDKLYNKVKTKTDRSGGYGKGISPNAMESFNEIWLKKKTMFADKIEKLAKTQK